MASAWDYTGLSSIVRRKLLEVTNARWTTSAGSRLFRGREISWVYAVIGHRFNGLTHTTRPKPWVFGVARTALGLAVGIAFGTLALKSGLIRSEPFFYFALAPVRMGEWLLILWLFYAKAGLRGGRLAGYAVGGSAWSYLLDIPAIMAVFVIPGGAWVC